MEMILSAPVIVKILVSLMLILVLNRLCKNLMASVAAGSLVLGLWSGHSLERIIEIAWVRFSSPNNLMLMLIIFQVISLSRQMSESGVMKDLVGAVQAKLSRRASMAALPAVIGLLPMPGGAIFSAPLVDDCDSDRSLQPMLKTRINYWFRHIWEYWWPLYPGVLLTLEITGLDVWQLVLLQLPLSIATVTIGYFFLLRKVRRPDDKIETRKAGNRKSIIVLIAPILVVIACYTSIRLINLFLLQISINRYLPMTIGILGAILMVQYQRPMGMKVWKGILFSKRPYLLAALVALVMIYGAFIETDLPDGTPLVSQMEMELDRIGVPIIAIIMIIPFISGMATGLAVGFVGASFPIVISLLGKDPGTGTLLSTIILTYGFGYIGMMLSPVHICLIVTNEHFRTRLSRSLFGIIKPAAVMLAVIIILHFAVKLIFTA